MNKDFNTWNEQKKELEGMKQKYLFKQGEVWWCAVGVNVADESCGKGGAFGRPVLILKKLSSRSFIGIPLSTKKKTGTWFAEVTVLDETVLALLYQVKMFSVNRLQRRLTTLDIKDFKSIKGKLETLLELSE